MRFLLSHCPLLGVQITNNNSLLLQLTPLSAQLYSGSNAWPLCIHKPLNSSAPFRYTHILYYAEHSSDSSSVPLRQLSSLAVWTEQRQLRCYGDDGGPRLGWWFTGCT
ncbi:hypothetical protein M0R45_010191 [Rubus argutus]|uniref:Uncharacterized protein n=1 Tax=Rubus argutus TaxID=59490 RepID=A0AAW1Y796_RUBAR